MERAGLAVADETARLARSRGRVAVLCGPGNNGGDGFIVAAALKKAGWPVRVACLVKKNALKGDAALAAKHWDGEPEALNSNLSLKDTGLVVDAVFGTGFSRALEPELVTLFDKIRARKIPSAAIDLPSGLDASTGLAAAGTLEAKLTVTFCRKKIGHLLLPGRALCGKIALAAIGIPDQAVAANAAQVFENEPPLWLKDFPRPKIDAHKFERGHTVIYGGSLRTGAACLAAAAAQRIGAGLVTVASRPDALALYCGYRASIMTEPWMTADEFRALLRDERKNAVVLGPGGGVDDALRDSTRSVLALNKKAVFDADFFTAFKDGAKEFSGKLSPARHVLTPHEGEFERFFGVLEGHKLERAQKAARAAQAIVVLKGADTVIAAPDGLAAINANAPPSLATAGSGDVLAGFIAGLVAQGMPPFQAACASVWLHGETARIFGFGLTAEDIIANVPQVLNRLLGTPAENG
jgi:NAD(P)H-hydrate epimerase